MKASNINVTKDKMQTILKYCIIALLCFYIFYIPSMSYTSKLNLISYFLLPLLSFLIVTYILMFKKINIIDLKVPIFFLLIFIAFAFISTLFGERQFSSLPRLYLVLISGFVIFGALYVFKKPKNAIITISLSMFAFVIFYFGYSFIFYRERLLGWITLKEDNPLTLMFFRKIGLDGGGGPNIISSFFGTASVMFLYLALFEKEKKFKLFLVPFFVCVFAGITTGSRQFIIGIFIVSVFLYFIAVRKNKILTTISIIVLITFLVLFMTLKVFEPIRNPILDGFGLLENSRGDKSASSRLLMQIEAFEIGGNRLFFGFGADGFETVSGWGGYAHNTYANLYVSFGVIGIILYFLPIIIMLLELRRFRSAFFWFVMSLFLFYAIIGLFIVWYKDKIFFIAYSFIIYFYVLEKNNKQKTTQLSFEINI